MGSVLRAIKTNVRCGGRLEALDAKADMRRNKRAVAEQKAATERAARAERKAAYAKGELPKCGGHEMEGV